MRSLVGYGWRALGGVALLALGACASSKATGPYTATEPVERSTVKAEALTHQAIAALDAGDPERAETLLREAVDADLFYGPARNNLGVLLLKQRNLYEAARQFEWARKLMPGHPDPRYNLGLTLERAGRPTDAMEAYAAALEVQTEYMPAIQAVARLELRRGLSSERLPDMLGTVALRGETPEWRAWAQRQLALRR